MPRSKNKVASRKRRKKMLKMSRGYWGLRKNVWTVAKNHIEKALLYQYRDRRNRKREFRRLWIIRINAAARLNGTTYSRLINDLKNSNVLINRKILADLATNQPQAFAQLVQAVKS